MVDQEEEISKLFTIVANALTHQIIDFEYKDLKIGRGIFIINYLGYYDQCTMRTIVDYMNIPASTATRITDRLVGKNLVKRTVSDKDRRAVVLSLTDLGKEVYLYHEKIQALALAVLLKDLSEEELSIVVKVLRKIVKNIEEFRTSKSDD